LKDTFEQVNNGRHPSFTLPKRIEVVVPVALLGTADLSVRIIDTKGIDRTAARADLEVHLDEPHTLAVLCSNFNNAPAAEARLLIERAIDTGVRSLATNSALLILPRPNEALAVKDESGIRVETAKEGYELKGEQIAMALDPLGLGQCAIGFFNALEDEPNQLQTFLTKRLLEITSDARALLMNHEQEQVQEVIRHATTMLRTWTKQNAAMPRLSAHLQESLLSELAKAYASTIRASVRREGEWPNLSYPHHLGYGARRVASRSLNRAIDGFSELCKTMMANPEFAEAQDLVSQAERALVASFEELLRKVQVMGQTSFRDQLKLDTAFWARCESEWGRGPGYRDRVSSHNEEWFQSEPRQELEIELWSLIEREWSDALSKLTSLFDVEY
jgi:hypothetical protein